MSLKSFSEQHEYLTNKLDDPSLFDAGRWNFIKIVQHGLIYCNNNNSHKLIRNYLNLPSIIIKLIYWLKKMKNLGTKETYIFKHVLVFESGRSFVDHNGRSQSVYFKRPIDAIGRENVSIIALHDNQKSSHDYTLSSLRKIAGQGGIDKQAAELLVAIKTCITKIKLSKKFSGEELVYIFSSFHLFFEEFLEFHEILKTQRVKTCLFYPHYHREGMVAAAQIQGIKMVELQHGLIAENDLYYAYNIPVERIARKAFFPDCILLMGEYWKDVVLRGKEHNNDTAIVVGDYSGISKSSTHSQEKENLIFIGAQKNMAPEYVKYTLKLLNIIEKTHPEWAVELKMHPLEKQNNIYEEIQHPNFKLIGNEGDLNDIIQRCKIQISIYSTTLYDALGHDVVNFSIQEYSSYADYAADMIKEKVALPLSIEQDPIDIFLKNEKLVEKLLTRAEVYSEFQKDILLHEIKNENQTILNKL